MRREEKELIAKIGFSLAVNQIPPRGLLPFVGDIQSEVHKEGSIIYKWTNKIVTVRGGGVYITEMTL